MDISNPFLLIHSLDLDLGGRFLRSFTTSPTTLVVVVVLDDSNEDGCDSTHKGVAIPEIRGRRGGNGGWRTSMERVVTAIVVLGRLEDKCGEGGDGYSCIRVRV